MRLPVRGLLKRLLLGQCVAFLISLTGVSTTKLVNNNASYPLLQSVTSYLFIFMVYGPLYLFFRYKFRESRFLNYTFLSRWWKYAILAVVDLEANFCVVYAYQYTDLMSVQLLNFFTVPCVLVLSYFILKSKFALTHVLGSIIACGGVALLVGLDADGLSRSDAGSNPVLGDMLCLISSALYATSNVLTEWFVKPPKVASLNEDALSASEQIDVDAARSPDFCEGEERATGSQEDIVENFEETEETELKNVPVYLPVIENLAMMSIFALAFATIQFFAVEWRTFAPHRDAWSGEDWLFQIVFGLTMLLVYTGMPILFVLSSAAFANISLMTANIYAIIWNVTIFKIYPTKLFFVSYIIIVLGILLYNLTDVFRIPCCTKWNYPCGELSFESDDDTAFVSEPIEK